MTAHLFHNVKPKFVHIYDGAEPGLVDAVRAADFMRNEAGLERVDVRPDFACYWLKAAGLAGEGKWDIARKLAGLKVTQLDRRPVSREPLYGEISFESRFLDAGGRKPAGIIYDGFGLVALMAELIMPEEARLDHCHIILTNQLPGTWDADDLRYHARAAVYGFPSIISTTGLVEAPARPREFYIGRMMGAEPHESEHGAQKDFLVRGDERIAGALNGYLLQALFLHVTGYPFCDNPACRLYNAHWQAELLYAQLRDGASLCDAHRKEMESWS